MVTTFEERHLFRFMCSILACSCDRIHIIDFLKFIRTLAYLLFHRRFADEHVSLFQLLTATEQYIDLFKDNLMANPPVWYKSFVVCELFFQMPFFPIAAYAFYKGKFLFVVQYISMSTNFYSP